MRIHLKIGSSLRERLPQFARGEGELEIPGRAGASAETESATVADILVMLGLEEEDVNLMYRNHELVAPSARLRDGDRLALFPPNFIHFSQFYLKRKQQ
jgi:hypothetical protein